jgi:putative hemin transport protein
VSAAPGGRTPATERRGFSGSCALALRLLNGLTMDGLLSFGQPDELTDRWRALRDLDPFVSIADAAARLDVVEAELVASLCGMGAIRLQGPFGDLVRALPKLGRVRSVTRNSHASIETRGAYPAAGAGCAGAAGEIGARFFPDQWRYGYALDETVLGTSEPALCFYDARGAAVHEIHGERETDRTLFGRLVDLFACFDQTPGESIVLASGHRMLASAGTGTWLRQADAARPIAVASVADVLDAARREAIPVSFAVQSRGVVHRFSGLLHELDVTAGRLELRAPWLRAYAALDGIAEAWTVHTPSLDGPSTSIELLDRVARVVASISGARSPGQPETRHWRELVDSVPSLARTLR